jgi:DNA-binding SARP family transcriptional activator/pimeloyl-ACP methyl ester carboxylesterase
VKFRILGPLEVELSSGAIDVHSAKLQTVLGVLLLHANEVVSSERLIDELWGSRPPATAGKVIQTYVSQLRSLLGAEPITTQRPGYLLRVDKGGLDAERFRQMTAAGRRHAADGEIDSAVYCYREALELWRGEPLTGVVFESFARNEVERLEEERIAAVMDRVDCELAAGRHDDVVPELELLVKRYPLRERLLVQLMLALYRSGRQADALAVHRETRERLRDELGIEPGPSVKRLERQILLQDPDLDPPAGGEKPSAPAVSPMGRVARERPEIRYAKSGDVNIAYTVVGEGERDLVCIPGFITNVELIWDEESWGATFYRRLAAFCRVILFDKRGMGLSDRVAGVPLETRMDDARAVMDAVGVVRAPLLGMSEGGPMALLFAATYPDRTSALVLYGSDAPVRDRTPETPWIEPREGQLAGLEGWNEREWGTLEHARGSVGYFAPSLAGDEDIVRSWAIMNRQSASPGAVRAYSRMNIDIDIRSVLPMVQVPTLLVHRTDEAIDVRNSRYIAERVAGARLVELPGRDHAPAVNSEQIVCPMKEFLEGVWAADETDDVEVNRMLATILCTNIVVSDAPAAEQARRQLDRFRGRALDPNSRFVCASFEGPGRAIRCARAIAESVRHLGVEPRIGLHAGECERLDGGLGGATVDVGAAVAGRARPGEVLVSGTVKDLVADSGLPFEKRGSLELGTVGGECPLFAVTTNDLAPK